MGNCTPYSLISFTRELCDRSLPAPKDVSAMFQSCSLVILTMESAKPLVFSRCVSALRALFTCDVLPVRKRS